jgi:hypothetical protein
MNVDFTSVRNSNERAVYDAVAAWRQATPAWRTTPICWPTWPAWR